MSTIDKDQLPDDLQEENNLLLIQLYQVYEEFEQQCLQNKQQNEQLLSLESRVKQLQSLPAAKLTFLQKCTDRLGYTNHQDIAEIRSSEYMDIAWYLEQNPDVQESGMDAVEHYYKYGWKEGRAPGPAFNSSRYLKSNPDVASANVEPLLHYLRYGKDEERSCFGDVSLDSSNVLLTQIEQLKSERSSIASQFQQLEQNHQKLQSQTRLLTDNHQQLEKRYQQERNEWQNTESAYKKQVKQQKDASAQQDAMIEELKSFVLELQDQLTQLNTRYEQECEQRAIERETWQQAEVIYKEQARQQEDTAVQQNALIEQLQQQLERLTLVHEQSLEQHQESALHHKEVIAQSLELESRVLVVQEELAQLSQKYEQERELQSIERETWQKTETVYKEQAKQQEGASLQQKAMIEQLQKQLEHLTSQYEQTLEQHRSDRADWGSAAKLHQEKILQQEEVIVQSQQLQSRVLELQAELAQLSNRYEQAKELQRIERESWERAESVYKEGARQQGDVNARQKVVIEQLESQQTKLTLSLESIERVAAERLSQINELQQHTQSLQANETDLAARQQMMHEEVVRAEAQLDLVKDMLLRESSF